jgi:hypothetical protein
MGFKMGQNTPVQMMLKPEQNTNMHRKLQWIVQKETCMREGSKDPQRGSQGGGLARAQEWYMCANFCAASKSQEMGFGVWGPVSEWEEDQRRAKKRPRGSDAPSKTILRANKERPSQEVVLKRGERAKTSNKMSIPIHAGGLEGGGQHRDDIESVLCGDNAAQRGESVHMQTRARTHACVFLGKPQWHNFATKQAVFLYRWSKQSSGGRVQTHAHTGVCETAAAAKVRCASGVFRNKSRRKKGPRARPLKVKRPSHQS